MKNKILVAICLLALTSFLIFSCAKDVPVVVTNETTIEENEATTGGMREQNGVGSGGVETPRCVSDDVNSDKDSYASLANSPDISNEMGYDFRDYFMVDYPLGIDYISYYYDLSEFAHEKNILADEANFIMIYQLGISVMEIIDVFNNGDDSEIILTNTRFDQINEAIDLFQSYLDPSDEDISVILDNIQIDLVNLNGMKKSDLISYLL